jgi:integrase
MSRYVKSRVKDLDLEAKPAHVFVRGEYTNTKADRVVFLTEETTQQLKSWLSYKYRKRRICHGQDGKIVTEYRTMGVARVLGLKEPKGFLIVDVYPERRCNIKSRWQEYHSRL